MDFELRGGVGVYIGIRVHVGKLGGNDESVIAHQRSASGADPLLAVLCQWELCGACVATVE